MQVHAGFTCKAFGLSATGGEAMAQDVPGTARVGSHRYDEGDAAAAQGDVESEADELCVIDVQRI